MNIHPRGHFVVGYSLEKPTPITFLTDEALEHLSECAECNGKVDKAVRLIGQIEAHEKYVKIMKRFADREAMNLRGKRVK
jgi:hypothetical protein